MSVDRQFCEDQMLMKMAELGRKPTHDEILQDPRMPKGSDFAFYWSSLDEAISKIWSKYLTQSGVKPVARVKTLGENAQAIIKMREAQNRVLEGAVQTEKAAHSEEETAETAEDSVAEESITEVGSANEAKTEHSRQHSPYTLAELKVGMQRVQEYFGLSADVIPGQVQINQASKEIGTPCYSAFSRMFGPKKRWLQVLNEVEPEETKATSDITEVVMPVRVVQPGGKTDVLTTSEMVELDESVKPDTTEAGEQIELGRLAMEFMSEESPDGEETVTCIISSFEACLDVIINGKKTHLNINFGEE